MSDEVTITQQEEDKNQCAVRVFFGRRTMCCFLQLRGLVITNAAFLLTVEIVGLGLSINCPGEKSAIASECFGEARSSFSFVASNATLQVSIVAQIFAGVVPRMISSNFVEGSGKYWGAQRKQTKKQQQKQKKKKEEEEDKVDKVGDKLVNLLERLLRSGTSSSSSSANASSSTAQRNKRQSSHQAQVSSLLHLHSTEGFLYPAAMNDAAAESGRPRRRRRRSRRRGGEKEAILDENYDSEEDFPRRKIFLPLLLHLPKKETQAKRRRTRLSTTSLHQGRMELEHSHDNSWSKVRQDSRTIRSIGERKEEAKFSTYDHDDVDDIDSLSKKPIVRRSWTTTTTTDDEEEEEKDNIIDVEEKEREGLVRLDSIIDRKTKGRLSIGNIK